MKCLSKLTLVFFWGIVSSFGQAPDIAWTRTYGGSERDYGYSVQQTAEGGYIVAGKIWTGIGRINFGYLIKTDPLGDTSWTRTYKGYGASVQQTSDRGYIIAGAANLLTGWDDVYLIKTDSLGDTLWTKTYG